MAEYIGSIEIPEVVSAGTFPCVPDYGYGYAQNPSVAIHQFGSANAKIEQRFYQGTGSKRFVVRRSMLTEPERIALRDFWEGLSGSYGTFTYNCPNDNGIGTTAYTVRFANEPLSWEMLADYISSVGVTLIEVPATSPTYAVNSTSTRFPSSGLQTALLSQTQEIIPLVKIQPRESGYDAIYLSDRRCTVASQLYQPRLVDFDGISQGIGGESDEANFTFGNADRVMRELANDTDLTRASIEFSLYHVGSGIKVDLWKGEIVSWDLDSGPDFRVRAADGIYELTLPYPCRRISRTCWKKYDDGNGCPYTAQSTGLDTTHFPSVSAGSCDKGYDTANGCLGHGMKRYFGGILAKPQSVGIAQAFWRAALGVFMGNKGASRSGVADSLYESIMAEIYCNNPSYVDTDGTTKYGMPVPCKMASARDDGDTFQALGVVGEGPLTFGTGHTLDGMTAATGGERSIAGNDPAGTSDYFSLDITGDATYGNYRKVYTGGKTYDDNFAAGTAALVVRRADDKGLQLSTVEGHAMQAMVTYGLRGWVWTAANTRTWVTLTNPVWIAINMLLKAKGLRYADATTAEGYFDVTAAIAAAAICSTSVTKIIGTGSETQFTYQGVIAEEKPLRDWITDVLQNCIGYFTNSFGKLKIGIRSNSSAVEAFTTGNILFRSLQLKPNSPTFNYLTGYFNDQEYKCVQNSVNVIDEPHSELIGGAAAPLLMKAQLSLAGTSTKSQTARIITTRLREELGGINAAQWRDAREIAFRTTVLALNVEPGMVCSLTHDDMPSGSGEFRVLGWKLNKDYSIDIQGKTTVDEMYDLTVGPKPADVVADPVPVETVIAESPYVGLYAGLNDDGTVKDGRVTQSSLATGLRIPEVLSAMPVTGNVQGRIVFLTADDGIYLANHMYRFNGTAWTEEINATAIIGSLVAGQIGAGEIRTNHLLVIPESLQSDPYFDDLNCWAYNDGGWQIQLNTPTSACEALGVRRSMLLYDGVFTGTGANYLQRNPVRPFSGVGQKLRMRGRVWNASNQNFHIEGQFLDKDYAYISSMGISVPPGGVQSVSVQGTVPSGTCYLHFIVFNAGGSSFTGFVCFSEYKCDIANSADLFVDGSIDGKTITGALIQTNSEADRGVKLVPSGLAGYNSSGVKTIDVNASTGAVNITGALTAGAGSSIGAGYLTGIVDLARLNIAAQGWTISCTFSKLDADTVQWDSGYIVTADGTRYPSSPAVIAASNTGNMTGKRYIFYDLTYPNELRVTDTPTTALGSGKILVAVAQNGAVDPTWEVLQAQGGKSFDGASVAAGTIVGTSIAADTITSDKLYVTDLAAINATLGSVTGGVITGSTFRSTVDGDGNYMEWSGQTFKGMNGSSTLWEVNPRDGFMALVDLADSSFAKAINSTNVMTDHYWDELAAANTTEDRLAKQATVLTDFKATAWDVTSLFATLPRAYLISVNATIPAAGKFVPCISPVTITDGTYWEDPEDLGVYYWRFQFTRSVNPYTIMGAPTGGGSITVEQLMIVYPTRLDGHNYIYLTSDVSVSGISGNIRILSAIQ